MDEYESDFIDDTNLNSKLSQKQTDKIISGTIKSLYGINKHEFKWDSNLKLITYIDCKDEGIFETGYHRQS